MAKGGNGPSRCQPRGLSIRRPDSSTVLVNSSTKSGTPSVLATICAVTSGGSGRPATCSARVSTSAGARRSSAMLVTGIDGTDPFATAKPDARLIKLLIRARRFNTALVGSDSLPFAALAKREGVSPSYFTRLVRLSYLAPDIAQAILDGRQPRDLTANNLLAHSRLPLAWHEQRSVLGFA